MIGIIDSGISNIISVRNALSHLGISFVASDNPQELSKCSKLILPGVGSFDAGMQELNKKELSPVIKSFARAGAPILGICLGMQLMFSKSDEGDETGLSIASGSVEAFTASIKKVPHIGWNNLLEVGSIDILQNLPSLDFYFIHSYHCVFSNEIENAACEHEGFLFNAAFQKGNMFGVQFHPEKSQDAGLQILRNFCEL
jgi:imidazole glycerol-phosphate synthase subunit HisH|tara:strand:- start:3456 stop:4052 length:597 start_codon:yes stop_codon:yes gene_type:complete